MKKTVTVIGMSGVGKTRLGRILSQAGWFHYSHDYRIGTAYMAQELSAPVWIHDLSAMADYLKLPGDPAKGGLTLEEFKRRQSVYKDGEIRAALDMPDFLTGHDTFLNDTTGSLCELDRPDIVEMFAAHGPILYIKAGPAREKALFDRAMQAPKPLYYPPAFFDAALAEYMLALQVPDVAQIDPFDLYQWIFPKLFAARLPKYQAIADLYGYSVSSDAIAALQTGADFEALLAPLQK